MGLDWEKIILGFKRTTRKFLEDIVENISESFIVTDLSGKIVFFNKGSEKLFLYKPEEVIGRHVPRRRRYRMKYQPGSTAGYLLR